MRATVSPSRSISYSWSTMFPCALRSAPPSTSIAKRSQPDQRLVHGRDGTVVALDHDLVANAELPLLDLCDLAAGGVLEHEGLANAQCLPVPRYARFPSSSSIQKSSPIEAGFSRILKRRPLQVTASLVATPQSSSSVCDGHPSRFGNA